MKNFELVEQLIHALKEMKVSEIIVCAGARNIPIVEYLENLKSSANDPFVIAAFFEERSAAFYGLGRIKATGRPVAIVTTSGTAVIETYPAVVEAYYQGLPLIVVSADRPKNYRGSGAPQAIEQNGLFQKYCENSVDWDVQQKEFLIKFNPEKPFHFNLCFDEPLLDYSEKLFQKKYKLQIQVTPFQNFSTGPRKINPLVIISELNSDEREPVIQFLKQNKVYFVAESLSGLKNVPDIKDFELNHLFYSITNQDSIRFCQEYFDSIVRIGGVPTLRLWRDLEFELKNLTVYSFTRRPFSGLARPSRTFSLEDLGRLKVTGRRNQKLEKINDMVGLQKAHALKKYKESEQNYFSQLAALVESESLYLGNSLPVREWDEFSGVDQKRQDVYGNRGANGIDGQVSTYLGWAKNFKTSWCVVGDLTALYDLASLTMAPAKTTSKKRIVIVNNSGGQIFSRIFKNQKYLNSHKLNFRNWAAMFGWDYLSIQKISDLKKIKAKKNVIVEIFPKNIQSENFLNEVLKARS